MTAQLATQEAIVGLVTGSTYILLALGFTLIYGMLRLINFAQISIYTVGAFAYVGIYSAVSGLHGLPGVLDFVIAAVGAGLATGLLGLVLVATTWFPIRRAPTFALVVASLATLLLLEDLIQLLVTSAPVVAPNPFSGIIGQFVGVSITGSEVVVTVTSLVVSALLAVMVRRTRFGLGVRAVADNPSSARLAGVPYVRTVFAVFALAGALAGLAGALVSAQYGVATYDMGLDIGISGFAAAVLGGMGNIWGAVVGGLLLGEVSSFSVTVLPSAWSQAVIFGVLIAVLAVRPTGVLRTRSVERA